MNVLNPGMCFFNMAIVGLRNDIRQITAVQTLPAEVFSALYRSLSQFRCSYEDITVLSPPSLDYAKVNITPEFVQELQSILERLGRQCTSFNAMIGEFRQRSYYLADVLDPLVEDGSLLSDTQSMLFATFKRDIHPTPTPKTKTKANKN